MQNNTLICFGNIKEKIVERLLRLYRVMEQQPDTHYDELVVYCHLSKRLPLSNGFKEGEIRFEIQKLMEEILPNLHEFHLRTEIFKDLNCCHFPCHLSIMVRKSQRYLEWEPHCKCRFCHYSRCMSDAFLDFEGLMESEEALRMHLAPAMIHRYMSYFRTFMERHEQQHLAYN